MTQRLSRLVVAVTLPGVVYALACGNGGNTKGIHLEDAAGSDAGHGGSDGGSAACTATATYPATTWGSNAQATDLPATGSGSAAVAHQEVLRGPLDADAKPDVFALFLFAGAGGFGSGDITTGTFPIAGSDAAFSTCGICPVIETDVGSDGTPADFYTASSGTVTLTSVAGTLVGTITGASFVHVKKDAGGGPGDTPATDHCMSMIGSASFDVTLAAGSAALAPRRFP